VISFRFTGRYQIALRYEEDIKRDVKSMLNWLAYTGIFFLSKGWLPHMAIQRKGWQIGIFEMLIFQERGKLNTIIQIMLCKT